MNVKTPITRLKLPKGFERAELDFATYRDTSGILGYCNLCRQEKSCSMNAQLREALGEDYPYWSNRFVVVDVPNLNEDKFPESVGTRVFCRNYQSRQLRFLGGEGIYCDGVERLLTLIKREQTSQTD